MRGGDVPGARYAGWEANAPQAGSAELYADALEETREIAKPIGLCESLPRKAIAPSPPRRTPSRTTR